MKKKTKQQPGIAIYAYPPQGRRWVGKVIGNRFIKTIDLSEHLLLEPKGIGFDDSTLVDAKQAGATLAEIHDRNSQKVFYAPISTIQTKGIPIDRGWGIQTVLQLSYWSLEPPEEQLRLLQGV